MKDEGEESEENRQTGRDGGEKTQGRNRGERLRRETEGKDTEGRHVGGKTYERRRERVRRE
jgi:hypothetical protein